MFVFFILFCFNFADPSFGYDNLALIKSAWQSSTYRSDNTYNASKAVDGDKRQTLVSKTCAVSDLNQNTGTWRVDLGNVLSIHHIIIYYRKENDWVSFQGRLAGFFLYVSNTTNKEDGYLCLHNTQPPTDPMTIECVVHGRYVIFYNERKTGVTYPDYYFHDYVFNELCEVEVYGCPFLGFYGNNCNIPCPNNCQNRYCDIVYGSCLSCVDGYQGSSCDTPCTDNTYGPQCSLKCGNCYDGASCNHVTGICPNGCAAGWKGDKCDLECDNGWFGVNCSETCSANCLIGGDRLCYHKSGECPNGCNSGWQGLKCGTACNNDFYGINCTEKCGPCLNDGICNHVNGSCPEGCQPGWQGHDCKTECDNGMFGLRCLQKCSINCDSNATHLCHHTTGECTSGCSPGWEGDQCKKECSGLAYGPKCQTQCGSCLDREKCHHINGTCANGCSSGRQGYNCVDRCYETFYGINCMLNCSSNCVNRTCDAETGECTVVAKRMEETDNNTASLAGGIVGGLLLICVMAIVGIFLFRRHKTKTENPYEDPLHYEVTDKDTTYTTMSTNPSFDIYEEMSESPSAERKKFGEMKT